MKKSSFCGALTIIVSLLLATGCGEDSCPNCPEFTQKALMQGGMWFYYDQLLVGGYIIGIDFSRPEIDSVRVAGDIAELEMYEDVGVIEVHYEGPNNDTRFSSGDPIEITIYTPSGICFCLPTLLDGDVDTPNIVNWSTGWPDTADLGTEIVIEWNQIPNADFYAVETSYWYDSLGTYTKKENVFFQPDTTFSIPGTETEYNGYYNIVVRAFTGPYPDAAEGNITGGVVKGVISGITYISFEIAVGTGDPWPDIASSEATNKKAQLTVREILKQFRTF